MKFVPMIAMLKVSLYNDNYSHLFDRSTVMTLDQLTHNQRSKIKALPEDMDISHSLMEQGFVTHAEVMLAHRAPFKGPLAFKLQGAKVSIQPKVAEQIKIELI